MSGIVVKPAGPKPIRILYGTGATIRLVAVPGPAGPRGPVGGGAGGSPDLSLRAAQALGGHRLVSYDDVGRAELAQPTASSLLRLAGLTLGAAAAGDDAVVRATGAVFEASWSWTAGGRLYLGPAGTLTQTPPASGPIQVIGVALSPTRITIAPQVLIERP